MREIQKNDIVELFGGRLHSDERYLYPTGNESVESRIVDRFLEMRFTGQSITLVDGAFDVPHNNHEWYLRHCKIIGAFASVSALSDRDISLEDFISHIWHDPRILSQAKLAVTVDADEKVAMKKSGASDKGGVERPIYPWSARADRLAGYHFSYACTLHQTVDLVTVEGDSIHLGTPLESSLALAAFLKSENLLDTFIVFDEHSGTVDEAVNLGLNPVLIAESEDYDINPQTGAAWSSSKIIRRAQGEPVPIPITRPRGL